MQFEVKYNDGKVAKTHNLQARVKGSYLVLKNPETNKVLANWRLEEIKISEFIEGNKQYLLNNKSEPESSLFISQEDYKKLKSYLPKKDFSFNFFEMKKEIFIPLVILAVFMAYSLISNVSNFGGVIHKFIPKSIEQKLGANVKSTLTNIFDTCNSQAGLDAIYKLADALKFKNKEVKNDLEIVILKDSDIQNAMATPGNKIYFFDGLIKKAEDQSVVAGVLAHEIGHLHHKHSMQTLSRSIALSAIFGFVLGDITNIAYIGELLTEMKYSRGDEAEADEFASKVLNKSQISSSGIQNFFKSITLSLEQKTTAKSNHKTTTDRFFDYFSTHPETSGRVSFYQSNDKVKKPKKILTDMEWQQLKNICD